MSAPALQVDFFVTDLCEEYRQGRHAFFAGRERELSRLLDIVNRRTKRNPLLLGPPGVGKTAIVEATARLIADGRSGLPASTALYSLDLGALLSGTTYRGDFEERVQGLLTRIRSRDTPCLLFVDEIHLLVRAGRAEGGLDAGNLLKPLLARGEISVIGASTPSEWFQVADSDPPLARRFQVLEVNEPDPVLAFDMVRSAADGLERHHCVFIPDEVVRAAVERAPALSPGFMLPDSAIDLLDDACVRLGRGRREGAGSVPVGLPAVMSRSLDIRAYARLKWPFGGLGHQGPAVLGLEHLQPDSGLLSKHLLDAGVKNPE